MAGFRENGGAQTLAHTHEIGLDVGQDVRSCGDNATWKQPGQGTVASRELALPLLVELELHDVALTHPYLSALLWAAAALVHQPSDSRAESPSGVKTEQLSPVPWPVCLGRWAARAPALHQEGPGAVTESDCRSVSRQRSC